MVGINPAVGEAVQVNLWSDAWSRLRRNRLARAAAVWLVFIAAVAIIALFYTPYRMSAVGIAVPYSGPSQAHLLGADELGRDVLSRLMVGAGVSLLVAVSAEALILVIGIPVGLIAGYYRGWFDSVISFVINVFYGIPDLLVAMILVVLIGPSLVNVIFALVVTRWMDMARLVRGQTLTLREREFVEAALASGARPTKVLFGHILPNSLGPIIVAATFGIPSAILFEAFLSFLGVGVQQPTPSWGSMAKEGVDAIRFAPHMVLAPAIVLSITLMACNFLGDGLRDALDPRSMRDRL